MKTRNMFNEKLSRALTAGPQVAHGENAFACRGVSAAEYVGCVPVLPLPEHVSAK